jgi:catechol 2,3-dioxygenase-like lactoylglutathione lyase family enzyme
MNKKQLSVMTTIFESYKKHMSKRPRIAMKVTDLATSLVFYVNNLGFDLVESKPEVDTALVLDSDDNSFWGCILLAGPQVEDVRVHLDEPRVVYKPGDTLDFLENDIDAKCVNLIGKGLGDMKVEDNIWGDRKLTLKDPDGYTIVFLTPAKPSPEKMAALYEQGGEELSSILADLGEPELDLVRAPGEWSIRQIVHHLAETDSLFLLPIKTALAQPGSAYVRNAYDQDAWVKTLDYTGRAIEPSLALVRAIRRHISQLLQHIPDNSEHYVILKWVDEEGEGHKVTVGDFVESIVRHQADHCEEIRETLRIHGS